MYKGGEENNKGEGKGGDKAELVSRSSRFLSCSLFKA